MFYDHVLCYTNTGLTVSITSLAIALLGSVIPVTVVFWKHAEMVDSLILRSTYGTHYCGKHSCIHQCAFTKISHNKSFNNGVSRQKCSFKRPILLFCLWFLLLLSGDVELNPGPLSLSMFNSLMNYHCTLHEL